MVVRKRTNTAHCISMENEKGLLQNRFLKNAVIQKSCSGLSKRRSGTTFLAPNFCFRVCILHCATRPFSTPQGFPNRIFHQRKGPCGRSTKSKPVFGGSNPRKPLALLEKRLPSKIARQSWWERVDSNHRSQRQQIYSLPPLATRELSHIKFVELVDGLEPPTC